MKLVLGFLIVMSTNVFAQGRGQGPDEATREAMDSCASELGLTKPERGSRPSEEEREKMEACLSDKGIELKQRPKR